MGLHSSVGMRLLEGIENRQGNNYAGAFSLEIKGE